MSGIALAPGPPAETAPASLRWGLSFAFVLLAHLGLGLLLWPRTPPARESVPPPAVLIDLQPASPAAPEELPQPEPAAPPPPPQPAAEPPPPEPDIPPPEPSPPPDVQPAPQAVAPEVALPLPPPLVRPPPPRPRPVKRPSPAAPPQAAPPTATPSPTAAPRAAPAAPPVAAAPAGASAAQAATNWQGRLLAHLNRFKRYPAEALMRRQQGVSLLRFTMTRAGAVIAFRLERSSGHELLDQETLAMIQRAQPLPALPPEMSQQAIELTVPLRFDLH